MADPLKFPQIDRPLNFRGGADAWDDQLAGLIVTAEYFGVEEEEPPIEEDKYDYTRLRRRRR